MNFKLYMMTALLGLGLTSVNANAAFVDVTSLATVFGSSGSLNLLKANSDPFTVNFSDASKVQTILYSNNENVDVGNQSPANVGNVIKTQFGLSSVVEVDKAGNGNIASNHGPFQYLAVHIGNDRELFFKFLLGIEEFTVTAPGPRNGIGDWRVYNGTVVPPPNAVPVPAAVWLFGSALAGLIGTSRRKLQTTVSA